MIYNLLKSKRNFNKDLCTWNANDRLFALDLGDKFAFKTAPIDMESGLLNDLGNKTLQRYLLFLKSDFNIEREIGVDYIKADDLKISLPYNYYGALIETESEFELLDSTAFGFYHENGDKPQWTLNGNTATVKDGSYYIVIKTEGSLSLCERGIKACGKTVFAFGIALDVVDKSCEELLSSSNALLDKSRSFWEDYLGSCPVIDNGDNKLLIREYWHWWCALINVSNVEFNKFPLYMAPDRNSWLGTWSNDGPETMAALALTNQKELAKELIISYIDAAINDEGIHSWYLHSDGIGCFGREKDVGYLSQGVPNIIHTLDFYIRNTGDKDILNCSLCSMTVYEKIKLYFEKMFELRDLDNDGLIEWRNLWETGWDDKLGCFFKKASLQDWCRMSSDFSNEEREEFYKENSYPVVAIVEQVYTRWALVSLKNMAEIMGDSATAMQCQEKYTLSLKSFEEKCWDEEDGFYYDYSVRESCKIKAKSADCFYAMYFEQDKERLNRVLEKLFSKNEFASACVPMQSMNTEGFSPTGYWSGGHWPREMSYLSMGLFSAGEKKLAEDIVIKAIKTGQGDCLHEVINPITAQSSSSVTKMAYDVLNIVALLYINGKLEW